MGFHSSTTNTTISATADFELPEIVAPAMFSSTPMSSPPRNAPIIEVNPPSTAATKPLSTSGRPIEGDSTDDVVARISASAAIAVPMPHASADTRPALMPISRATERFSAIARICTPQRVLKNHVSATTTRIPTAIVTSWVIAMIWPPTSKRVPAHGAPRLRGAAPQYSWMPAPIA